MAFVCNCFTQYYAVSRFPMISINLKNIKAGFVNWLVCNKRVLLLKLVRGQSSAASILIESFMV